MTAPDVRTSPARGTFTEDQGTQNPGIVSAFDPHGKALAHATARAALGGFTLHELAGGGYLLGRGMNRELPSLHAVHLLLASMGVR
jgi:hypothetical protein